MKKITNPLSNEGGKETYLLGEMPLRKAYWSMALPALLTMLAKAIYSMVDTAYIGLLHDTSALAALGILFPVILILTAVETTLAQGVVIIVGRKLGTNEKDEADKVVSTAFVTSIAIGIFLFAFGFIFMTPMLKLFGATETILPYAQQYAVWLFVGMLFTMPGNALSSAARGESAAKVASIGMILGTVLNIIIDPLFIFDWGLGLGVAGASLATAISQTVSFVYILSFYLRKKSLVRIRRSAIKPTASLYKMLIGIGLPMAVMQLSLSLSMATTNRALSVFGDHNIAAYSVVQKLVQVIIIMFLGLIAAMQPIAAYSMGAGNKERFSSVLTYVMKVICITGVSLAIIFFVFATPILSFFSSDSQVIEVGVWIMRSQTITSALFGMVALMMMACQILGKPKQGIFLSLLRQVLLYLPLMIILPMLFGFTGALIAPIAADILAFGVCLFLIPWIKREVSNITAKNELSIEQSKGGV